MNFRYALQLVAVGVLLALYAYGLITLFYYWFYFHAEISAIQAVTLEIVFAILFTVFLHVVSRPVLEILPKEDTIGPDRTYVHVYVKNKRAWFLFRETAVNCVSKVKFTDRDSNTHISETKWESKPNPVLPVLSWHYQPEHVWETFQRIPAIIPDQTKLGASLIEDIPAGAKRSLDIAFKNKGESHCYAGHPATFFGPKYLEEHRLSRDYYRVRIEATSDNAYPVIAERILLNLDSDPPELQIINPKEPLVVKFCRICGRTIKITAKFCDKCGVAD